MRSLQPFGRTNCYQAARLQLRLVPRNLDGISQVAGVVQSLFYSDTVSNVMKYTQHTVRIAMPKI